MLNLSTVVWKKIKNTWIYDLFSDAKRSVVHGYKVKTIDVNSVFCNHHEVTGGWRYLLLSDCVVLEMTLIITEGIESPIKRKMI